MKVSIRLNKIVSTVQYHHRVVVKETRRLAHVHNVFLEKLLGAIFDNEEKEDQDVVDIIEINKN